MFLELRILSYEDRVQQCKLTTLETRVVRGGRVGVFKIISGIEGLDSGICFLNIRQTTDHEDIVGRWLKNGVHYTYESMHFLNERYMNGTDC